MQYVINAWHRLTLNQHPFTELTQAIDGVPNRTYIIWMSATPWFVMLNIIEVSDWIVYYAWFHIIKFLVLMGKWCTCSWYKKRLNGSFWKKKMSLTDNVHISLMRGKEEYTSLQKLCQNKAIKGDKIMKNTCNRIRVFLIYLTKWNCFGGK